LLQKAGDTLTKVQASGVAKIKKTLKTPAATEIDASMARPLIIKWLLKDIKSVEKSLLTKAN